MDKYKLSRYVLAVISVQFFSSSKKYLQIKVNQKNREVSDMVFCNVLSGSYFMCRLYKCYSPHFSSKPFFSPNRIRMYNRNFRVHWRKNKVFGNSGQPAIFTSMNVMAKRLHVSLRFSILPTLFMSYHIIFDN